VFRYAIATGRAERDISADLRGALVPVVSQNHAALSPIQPKLARCFARSTVMKDSRSRPQP